MRLETFFDNFGLLADAPNGVQKLRELILQLAVQGKLVLQDPNDEPASVLLEKIKAEKERLVKEGKIRKFEHLSLVEDVPFELPLTWTWSNLSNITLLVTDGEHATPTRISVLEVPLATAKNIRDGYLDLENTDFVSYETAKKCWKRCEPMHDDILMVCVGATTGRLCLLKHPPKFVLVRSVALIRPFKSHLYPAYTAIVIKSPLGQSQIWNKVKQSAQPCLYINKIQRLCIPIPPLAEQKRIVAKVDQLMALCDELEARQQKRRESRVLLNNTAFDQLLTTREPDAFAKHWQRICDNFDLLYSAPENISKLRQAILQLAVQGKLVPQDPMDEPASVLLEKIKFEKERLFKEGKVKKDKPLPPIEVNEIPSELPKGWTVGRLGNLVLDFQNGISTRKSENGEPIPVLRLADIKAGQLSEASLREISLPLNEIDKYQIIKGDILVIRVNGSAEIVGRFVPCLVNKKWAYCDHLIRVRIPFHFLEQNYLCIFGSGNEARKHVIGKTITTAGQKTINQAGLASLLVWVPPLNEQKRIVAKVNQLIALCDELETKLTQSHVDSESLMDAVVRQVLVV